MPEIEHSSDNKRIAKNTVFLYMRMLFLMFLGFYSSRVTLKILGQEDLGTYNIVAGVIVLFQFLNASLTSAMQRYLNIAIGEKDLSVSEKVFSICFRVYLILSVILLFLCETVGVFILNYYLIIPSERMVAANILFHISSITMVISMLRIPFHSAIITTEKMTFFAYVSIVEGVLKLIIIFALKIGTFDKLVLYGILNFVVSLIMLFIFYVFCKKNIDFITFKRYKDVNLLKSMMSFSGWSVFGSFASVAVNQGINVFINHFYGVLLNAAMAIANQANNAVTSFLTNFQTAFNPQLVKSYAQNDMEYVYTLSYKTSKYSFFLMYFIILPFSINLDFVLNVWLTEVPKMSSEFINIMLLISLIDALADPFWMLAMAEGNIKKYQFVGAISMLLILPIVYILLYLGFPAYWTLFVKFLQGAVFFVYRLVYLKNRINLPIKKFIKTVLVRVLFIMLISYPTIYFIHMLSGELGKISQFFISCFASCIVLALLYWTIGITSQERKLVKQFFQKKLNKVTKG